LGVDAIVAVVGDTLCGYSCGSCAEGIETDDLDLPGGQLQLLDALSRPGLPSLVTVLITGRPVTFGVGPNAPTGAHNGLLARLPAGAGRVAPGAGGRPRHLGHSYGLGQPKPPAVPAIIPDGGHMHIMIVHIACTSRKLVKL
jgi:hypothetical protein